MLLGMTTNAVQDSVLDPGQRTSGEELIKFM
jgi:hypothetical protein